MIRTSAAAAVVGLGLIASGTGVASASPAGTVPTFTFTSHLESLLPAASRLTRITGADSPMQVLASEADLGEGTANVAPAECAAAFEPGRRAAYADTGWTGVSMQVVADDTPRAAGHVVVQAVVSFADRNAAMEVLNAAARTWVRCGGETVGYTTSSGDVRRWQLGTPELRRDKTMLVQLQTSRSGSCERAMTTADLGGAAIVADVMACDFGGANPDGQGEAIAAAITTNAERAS